jgi:uncharacterized membrane protein YccC
LRLLPDQLLICMNSQTRRLHYFFFGQNFSDGVRITLSILLPTLVLAQLGYFAEGLTVSTGAVCVSITDMPGPVGHKRNGMLAGLGFVVGAALLTGLVAPHVWLLGLAVVALSFFFTMFLVWGVRASAVGTAALLAMVLTLAQPQPPGLALLHGGLLLLGGLWYLGLALLVHRVQPYRPAQQAVGECVHAIAYFLDLKARFYNPSTKLDDDFRQLVAQQVVVNEKQEAVRELLFRTRQIVNETTSTGRRLVLTFVETVDLYEQVTAIHYDYAMVRSVFGDSGNAGGSVEADSADWHRSRPPRRGHSGGPLHPARARQPGRGPHAAAKPRGRPRRRAQSRRPQPRAEENPGQPARHHQAGRKHPALLRRKPAAQAQC